MLGRKNTWNGFLSKLFPHFWPTIPTPSWKFWKVLLHPWHVWSSISGVLTCFHGEKLILPNFSSLSGVATLYCDYHGQAGSTMRYWSGALVTQYLIISRMIWSGTNGPPSWVGLVGGLSCPRLGFVLRNHQFIIHYQLLIIHYPWFIINYLLLIINHLVSILHSSLLCPRPGSSLRRRATWLPGGKKLFVVIAKRLRARIRIVRV